MQTTTSHGTENHMTSLGNFNRIPLGIFPGSKSGYI